MKLYKKCTAEKYPFLVNDTTLQSDNHLHFSKNLLKLIYKKTMTIDGQIKVEKIQYNINREAAKYPPYYQEKLINTNTLKVKKYYILIKTK